MLSLLEYVDVYISVSRKLSIKKYFCLVSWYTQNYYLPTGHEKLFVIIIIST